MPRVVPQQYRKAPWFVTIRPWVMDSFVLLAILAVLLGGYCAL